MTGVSKLRNQGRRCYGSASPNSELHHIDESDNSGKHAGGFASKV